MGLAQALGTVTSALVTNASRAAVAADNIANVHSRDYRPRELVQETLATKLTASGAYTPGGVRGLVRISNELNEVDLASEFVDLLVAENAYKGAALVGRTVDDMAAALVDIKA